MSEAILTDVNGRPIERPTLREGATIEEKIAWLRADNAYRDKIASLANVAFTKQFNRSRKES